MRLAGLTVLLLAGMPFAALAAGDPPVRVTTDSPAYCRELCQRFHDLSGTSTAEARRLAERGRQLCESGHVRTGIAKLRRALRASQTAGQAADE